MSMMDDHIAAFTLKGGAVRGRILRAASALDAAVGHNRYPEPVANLLAEALMISALVAHSLKFKGRIIVQAMGTNDGAVSMLVAETTSEGQMRAYARFDQDMLAKILSEHPKPGVQDLTGGGTFALTIDQGQDMERYQSLAAIEGDTFSGIVEHYFAKSEQVPTRIQMAVGRLHTPPAKEILRGGAIMAQRVANDENRADVQESWTLVEAVMNTLSDEELLDPDLASERLLYRLFHEQGVAMEVAKPISAYCGCSKQRLHNTLKSFDDQAIEDMIENGVISAKCEFCHTDYKFTKSDLRPPKART
ncbi:MAG TPA: molecular chaperone Hsp33 [Hellea balneolensis]|uniref:Molecular chaperone Hsp33 n=1 Tax=Hellea balneolensis TaxID=287478 RepID=A0A7C5M0B1_9PROT|nr:molecular chaperone Hsp33 [Hellea balneolensis]